MPGKHIIPVFMTGGGECQFLCQEPDFVMVSWAATAIPSKSQPITLGEPRIALLGIKEPVKDDPENTMRRKPENPQTQSRPADSAGES